MKKIVPFAPVFSLVLGLVAMGLRLWMLAGGVDDQGLYPRFHPAWILLCLMSVAVLCLCFLLSHHTERRRTYRDNFPPSLPAAIGSLAAAVGIAVTVIGDWEETSLLVSLFSLLCCGGLVWAGLLRLQGKKRPFFIPAALCLLFAIRIFSMGKLLGSEPELNRFLFPFVAILATLPACYQQWGFDVNLGDRCKSLFWSLTAGYLCLAAVPGISQWPLYLGTALWLLAGTCSLQPIRRSRETSQETDPEAEPAAESWGLPSEEETDPIAENVDTDALIADILRDMEE